MDCSKFLENEIRSAKKNPLQKGKDFVARSGLEPEASGL